MPKRKRDIANRFQELAIHLEKALGLGGTKTSRFIEGLSKNLGPMLERLEAAAVLSKSIPMDVVQSIFQAYLKQVAKDAGISWKDLQKTMEDFLALLKEGFKPEEILGTLSKLVSLYVLRGQQELEREVDEFGMDPAWVDAVRPLFEFLFRDYWRVTVKGIENIPANGRCLLVANHSGVLPFDGAMITVACLKEHRAHRHVRFLIEDFVYHFPFLGTFMHRIGAVRACPENATWLLKKNQLVLVFPEGVKGLGKLYSERYQLKRFGRGGFVKLAIKTKTPIIPVSVVGAEEIYPVIWKSNILAKAFGVPYLPVTPTFPWLGPIGMIPLPTKWRIEIGKPISFDKIKPKQIDDEILINKLSEKVRDEIQTLVDKNLKKRKSVWLG